jgi:hypothetical protein
MVGAIEQLDDGRLEQIVTFADGYADRKVERAAKELQRRKRNRQRFVRGLDEEELEEIVTGPSWVMGPYDSRALEAGVDVDGSTLEALAEEEIERRSRERRVEQEQPPPFEPVRVVPR